ncbi:hypothetical protein HC028_24565 [Planosporangium flavigriseum]|nr:hypothetical protein [Planosporangium flavigriseum]NJC67652.1 hypothetical protein [Planosporangium flavigriseum]
MAPRTGLGLAAALATLLAGSATACRPSTEAAPAGESGAATCPDTFVEEPRPTPGRTGQLVPEGADAALLCVYPFQPDERTGVYRLGKVVADVKRPAQVVEHLNALADVDRTAMSACSLMAHDQYQVILGYPANTHTIARIDYNCGTASSAGAVRALGRVGDLLAFWPDR